MNFASFPRTALLVLADAIGRIDYAAADMEAAREAIRDGVAAAIAGQDSPAPMTRQITLDDLGPEARTDALQAVARGADEMRYTTTGVEYYKGGILLNPEPRLPGQLPGETYQAAEDRRAADLMRLR